MPTPAPLPTPSPTSQQPQAPIISSPTPSPQKELRGGGVGVPRGGGTSQTKRTRPEQRALNYTWGEGSAISGALVSGVAGGVGVPHPAGQGREQGTRGELQSPISRGWGPHRGTPRSGGSIIPVSLAQRVPHGECPRPSALPGWVSLNIFAWKTSSLPWVQPEGGWGGAALGKAILGGKSHFPQCGAGPDARGTGSRPCGVEGTAAGLGMSPVATPRCHTLSSTIHPTREGPGRIQPRELLIHPTKGLETPSQNPSCGRWGWREGEAINKSNFYGWLRSL